MLLEHSLVDIEHSREYLYVIKSMQTWLNNVKHKVTMPIVIVHVIMARCCHHGSTTLSIRLGHGNFHMSMTCVCPQNLPLRKHKLQLTSWCVTTWHLPWDK